MVVFKTILLGVVGVFLFALGVWGGSFFRTSYMKTAVMYLGMTRDDVDYDTQAMVKYMQHRFEENGVKLSHVAYSGDLYNHDTNKAEYYIFVRGFEPFYDVRFTEGSKNFYYIHRAKSFYRYELENFDYYLFSQKSMFNSLSKQLPALFVESGYVENERLEPTEYKYDVLYIYESKDVAFVDLLKKRYKYHEYSGIRFAALSVKEQQKELAEAKVVIYELMSDKEWVDCDEEYVPFAVYDIISYGRPLVTDYRKNLDAQVGDLVFMYEENLEDKHNKVAEALRLSDRMRERTAEKAREKIFSIPQGNITFF